MTNKTNPALDKQLAGFERHLRAKRSPATVNKTMVRLRSLLANHTAGALAILEEKAETCSPYTVRDLHRVLSAFGKWAKLPALANCKAPRAGGCHRARAVFSAEDVRKLASCQEIPAERRLFWRLIYRLGLRLSEARVITSRSIKHTEAGFQLQLPAAAQKAGREDRIMVPTDLADAIRRNAPERAEDWTRHIGQPTTVGRMFDRDLETAGIGTHQGDAHRTPYDLRSFFVTELFRRGVPLPAVTVLARHADPSTTLKHYARLTAEEAQKVGATALEGL